MAVGSYSPLLNAHETDLAGCPLPFAHRDDNSGHVQWLEADLAEWMASSGLAQAVPSLRRARATGYARLACLEYPAASPDLLRLISRYFAFYFECDTSCVEHPALAGNAAEVAGEILRWWATVQDAEPAPPPAGRHMAAFRAISEHLHRLATPEQAERVHRGEQDYMLGVTCEAAYLAQGTLPTCAEYHLLRDCTTTPNWHLAFVEIAGGFEVPGDIRWRLDVRTISHTMGRLLGLINDLASWRKEARTSPPPLSYPVVIAHERGCTLVEAVQETADLLVAEARLFNDQTERLINEGGAVGRLAAGARDCVAGWHRWHVVSERFSSASNHG